MRRSSFKPLVAALAGFALLIAGFAASSAAAGMLCDMSMPMSVAAAGMPCEQGHEKDGASDPERVPPAAPTCFAKCPAPILGLVPIPAFAAVFFLALLPTPRSSAMPGIGVAPPLEPPRA